MNILIIVLLFLIAAETTFTAVQSVKKVSYGKNFKPIFVDTSVLIDGRIISVAESGFITSTLQIPRSVVGELQFLADQGDHEKRSRARHGLDIVAELQNLPQVKVEIFADSNIAEEGVDNRLLKLAKQYNGSICTIDFNLNKVAQVENIPVLNVNDLAMKLRMAYLPGERTTIELTQKGNDSHQAVGHLADGTMVVVEQASSLIGKKAEIEFIRSLQTAAGKMMFAKLTMPVVREPRKNQAVPAVPKFVSNKASKPAENDGIQTSASTSIAPMKQNKPTTSQNKSNGRRPYPKRVNHEDNLIELVNKQQ